MRKLLYNSALFLSLLCTTFVCVGSTQVQRNQVYGMYSGLALLLDIYTPVTSNNRALVMIPGSGWEAALGYSAEELKSSPEIKYNLGIEALREAGYTVFVINHRSTPRFQYPAPIEDAQRAVRYIRYHAQRFGVDPQRIGAVGGSSGGHLVNLLGTLDGKGNKDDADPVNRESAKVQVVVSFYSVTDTTEFQTTNPWAAGALTALLGPVNPFWKPPSVQDADASMRYLQASPLYHLTQDDPPFLLIHGDADSIIPFSQSQLFHDALLKTGVPARLIRIKGGEHGPGLLRNNAESCTADMLQWLGIHLLEK